MKYIVSNQEELAELRNATLKMSLHSIAIESDAVQDSRLEKQLNRHYFACGCQSGSVCVLLTLLASAVAGLLYGFHGTFLWWKILIYLAVAAIVGKCLGLFWSHVQLHKIYRQLSSLLPPKARLMP
jgi:hypothetical protein